MNDSMDSVKVDKARLIGVIKANREKHQKEIEVAIRGYEADLKLALEERLEDLARGAVAVDHYFKLDKPVSHTEDYDRTLQKLDYSVDQNVTLQDHEFRMYVLDEWSWKREHQLRSSKYLG